MVKVAGMVLALGLAARAQSAPDLARLDLAKLNLAKMDLARKAAPELFANAAIELVQRGEAPPTVLQEAFEAAKQAKEPVKLIAMPQFAAGRPGMREAALRAGLDALSLEARAVTLLAKTDPDKAREMFQSLDHPAMERRSCEDPMIADDSAYFDMARLFLGHGVSLMSVVGPGNSPGELPGFAKLLVADSTLTPEEFGLTMGALGLKMQTAAPDYRQFVMTAQDLTLQLEGVAARARELGVPVDMLAQGARKYAVTQLSAARCHEEMRGGFEFTDWFNREFGKKFDAIRGDETIPGPDFGSAKGSVYFASGSGKELSEEFQKLKAARGKPEWAEKLQKFLDDFAEWKAEGAEIDAFHQRMTVMHGLYQVIPEGEERDKLVARAIDFMKSGGVEKEYPAEWWYEVRSFAESALSGKAKLMAAFQASGDVGLELLAALNPSVTQ